MPRPSKRKRAARKNLLKARAKRSKLRSLRVGSGNSSVAQVVRSGKDEYDVCLSNTAAEKSSPARAALWDDHKVAVSRPGPELNRDTEEVDSVSQLFSRNGSITKEHKTCVKKEGLHCCKLTAQPAGQGAMFEGSLLEDKFPRDCADELILILGQVSEDGVREHVAPSEKSEGVRPAEKTGKSYLKMCKENYRASKKTKLAASLSATNGSIEKVQGALLEGRRIATASV